MNADSVSKDIISPHDVRTLLFLQQIYDDVLMGVPFAKDSHDCAALLNPYFLSEDLSKKHNELCQFPPKSDAQNASVSEAIFSINVQRETSENESHSIFQGGKTILLQLTLIKMMLIKAQSQEPTVGIKQKYLEVIRILLKEASIDTKLIHLLCSSDKQLSHMASKSLVSLIHFQLTEEGSLNSAWFAFSSEALLKFPRNNWLADCLWTLAGMIREILKDEGLSQKGKLKAILGPFDKKLEGLYKSFASYYSAISEDVATSPKATNDLSSFLDLLEMLAASRIQMPLNYPCQRMMFSDAACVLGLSTVPVHNLVKRKSLMLLKKCILQKAGEDVLKRKTPPSLFHRDPPFESDRMALAGAILQFVNSGWLNRLSLSEKASRFGGSQVTPEVEMSGSPDQVALRALSMVLLKALEIKTQDLSSEVDIQVQLESVMDPLLRFLKRYLMFSPHVHLTEHPCVWISLLFIEQDDDLLEAAKALLTIHLKFERFQHEVDTTTCHSDLGTQDALTHRNGCNPHCIFFFLLKSIAFDATVLLDFLISFETCFLEYFVRYLKLLVEDWHQFVNISKYLEAGTSGNPSFSPERLLCSEGNTYRLDSDLKRVLYDPQSYSALVLNFPQTFSLSQHTDHQRRKPNGSQFLQASHNTSLPGSLQSLVDYESSEDSDLEWAGEEYLTDAKGTSSDNQTCVKEFHEQAGPSEPNMLNVSSPSHRKTSPDNSGLAEGMLRKSVKCFQELQGLVSRLHRRNLFPYNPGALLKLLTRVDTISKEDMPSYKRLYPVDV